MAVRVLAGQFEVDLGSEPVVVVPSTQIVLTVSGALSRNVFLDGRKMRLSSGAVGLLAVDLRRSTGYHRLVVGSDTFWFGTQDAKLRLEGIEAMLSELRAMGTGWTGQAMFSDGTGLLDPHVAYGWLDQWANIALQACSSILATPRASTRSGRTLRRRGGAGVMLAPTLRLLRSDPRRYLAPSLGGVIRVGGESYEPLRVVARQREITLDTVANRRCVAVLHFVDALARQVIEAGSTDSVTRSRLWSNQARALQRRPLAQVLRTQRIPRDPRQPEEITDSPYRLTYRLACDLSDHFGWSVTLQPRSRLSYVEQSDVIYQAYVASRIATELGLTQNGSVLGLQQPAFSDSSYNLYYDTEPPRELLRSWRFFSDRPDASRPDLLLHERATGRIALMDAKYRVGNDGRASEDSRKEISSYMALFALDAVSILYPSSRDPDVVTGKNKRILEVPVSPSVEDLSAGLAGILSTLQTPAY